MWLLFTGRHLCFFNFEYCETVKSFYFEEHLQTAASENVFIKIIHKEKIGFFNMIIGNK